MKNSKEKGNKEQRVAKDNGETNRFKSKYQTTPKSTSMGQCINKDKTVVPTYMAITVLSDRKLLHSEHQSGIFVVPATFWKMIYHEIAGAVGSQ